MSENKTNKEESPASCRSGVMPRFSPNYKREKHPLINRISALWRILTCRNFILIDYTEFIENGEKGKKIRILTRTDYDKESELLTLKGAFLMRSK